MVPLSLPWGRDPQAQSSGPCQGLIFLSTGGQDGSREAVKEQVQGSGNWPLGASGPVLS